MVQLKVVEAERLTHMRLSREQKPVLVRATLEEVFEAEETPLLRYAFGILGRREVAEEVVQEAFLKLHEHWEGVTAQRAWLYRCVRNLSLNVIRKSKRETLSDEAGEGEGMGEMPDEELGKMEAVGMMRVFIGEFNERDRKILEMKYFEDLKYEEIAAALNMSVGNVGYRLHHLLKELGDRLKKSGISHF